MRAYSFATLIAAVDCVPPASHVPVVIDGDGATIKMRGRVARANPH